MTDKDKRARDRRQVQIPVRIYDLSREMVVKCTMQDGSKNGCKLVTDELQNFPDEIILEFVKFKGSREGRIMWRDQNSVGVWFIDGEQAAPNSG